MDINSPLQMTDSVARKRKLFDDGESERVNVTTSIDGSCITECVNQLVNMIVCDLDCNANEKNTSLGGIEEVDYDELDDNFDESWLKMENFNSPPRNEPVDDQQKEKKEESEQSIQTDISFPIVGTHNINWSAYPCDATERASHILAEMDRIDENVTQFRRQLAANRQSIQHK